MFQKVLLLLCFLSVAESRFSRISGPFNREDQQLLSDSFKKHPRIKSMNYSEELGQGACKYAKSPDLEPIDSGIYGSILVQEYPIKRSIGEESNIEEALADWEPQLIAEYAETLGCCSTKNEIVCLFATIIQ